MTINAANMDHWGAAFDAVFRANHKTELEQLRTQYRDGLLTDLEYAATVCCMAQKMVDNALEKAPHF